MPGPVMRDPGADLGLPPWLSTLLNEIAINPAGGAIKSGGAAGEPILKSIGKQLSDLLGTVFKTNPSGAKLPGVPRKLRFSGMSTGGDLERREGNMLFQPDPREPGGMISTGVEAQPFEIAPSDMDSLLERGMAEIDQPPQAAVDTIQRKLREVLDQMGPEFKSQQYERRMKKRP